MTKLAMLIGAKPREKQGPIVRLEAGNYIAQLENVQDSVIMLCSIGQGVIGRMTQGVVFENLPSDDYWAQVTVIGKEKYINVSMEKVR